MVRLVATLAVKYEQEHRITASALRVLCSLIERLDAYVKLVAEIPGFIELVVKSLEPEESLERAIPGTRIVGHMCLGGDVVAQSLLDAGVVEALLRSLEYHSDQTMRRETCWSLCNFLTRNSDLVKQSILAGALPPIVQVICRETEEVQVEACWCLSSALSGAPNEMLSLIVVEVPDLLPALVIALEMTDADLSDAAMSAALRLIEHCNNFGDNDGSNPIVAYLRSHADQCIQEAAEDGCICAQRILELFVPENPL